MTNTTRFGNQIQEAKWLAFMICVVTIALGVLPEIFLQERLAPQIVADGW